MLLRGLALAVALGSAVVTGPIAPAAAQTMPANGEVSVPALAGALQLDALFAVLREEGLAFGETLETDMFPAGGGQHWRNAVSDIYDIPRLRSAFDAVLEAELAQEPEVLGEILAFFRSDLGKRIVALEIEARRAFLDTATEEAARVTAEDRFADRDPLVDLLRDFIAAGDLVEQNVAGALSGNLAFQTGISETGVFGDAVPQDQLMAEIWAQEDQIRDDTTTWLYAYLGLAYSPLSAAEMQAYVDFMASPAGGRLNAALFLAFHEVFRQVSYEMGRAAGIAIQGRDI